MFCRQRRAMLAVFTILLTAGPYCAAAYDLVRDYSAPLSLTAGTSLETGII